MIFLSVVFLFAVIMNPAIYTAINSGNDDGGSNSSFPPQLMGVYAQAEPASFSETFAKLSANHNEKDLTDCFFHKSETLLILSMQFQWKGCYEIADDLIKYGWILAHVTTDTDDDDERFYFVNTLK